MTQTTKKVNYEIRKNEAYNSFEIIFDGIPSAEIRNNLKGLKFRWNAAKKLWYGFESEETIRKALENVDGESETLVIPESKEIDPGTLYAGWEGGNYRKWKNDDELKAFIRDDFKKAGIKATIRQNRAGYLTSLTFTIQLEAGDIESYEDWKKNITSVWKVSSVGGWVQYRDENNNIKDMHIQDAAERINNGEEKLLENILRTRYDINKQHLTTNEARGDILTAKGKKKLETARAIVASYNRDCSNSMVDYFDRSIYDWYRFKV